MCFNMIHDVYLKDDIHINIIIMQKEKYYNQSYTSFWISWIRWKASFLNSNTRKEVALYFDDIKLCSY